MDKITVDPNRELRRSLLEAAQKVGDLTIPLNLISREWFKSNRAIFSLKGPGKYVDLTALYKERKRKSEGFIYPILKRSGRLEKSITDPTDPEAVSYIINKISLALGTTTPYAVYHHEGAGNNPVRPVVLFGNEQVAPQALNKRVEIWRRILMDYAKQVSGAV